MVQESEFKQMGKWRSMPEIRGRKARRKIELEKESEKRKRKKVKRKSERK